MYTPLYSTITAKTLAMNTNDVALSYKQRKRNQLHNVYNIFFVLELQSLVQETKGFWKSADKETKVYCSMVAHIVRERHTELSKAGGIDHLSTIDSTSTGPRKDVKQRSANSNTFLEQRTN